MFKLSQFYLKIFRPWFLGGIARLIYGSKYVIFGKKFRCDSIPRIIVDKNCKLKIGNNVEFKRNVEIRSHGNSLISIGNNVRLDRGIRILAANWAAIQIEDGVKVGLYTVMNGGDSISIGKKALVSGFVYLQTSMHGYGDKNLPVQEQGYVHAPVVLEEDAWLGTHVVILPGVTIGKGAVVGSNAVVTKNVEPFCVVGGIPAKLIKERI